MQRRIQSRISLEQAGRSVLEFLSKRFTYHTGEEWLTRVAAGRVLVNGSVAGAEWPLAVGDVVSYTVQDIHEPAVNLDLGVIYDDADIMVINKPPNLPCHPGGRYFNHTLWAELQRRTGLKGPSFINRLDRETSGLVVVAKHERAAKHCCNQFAKRRVTKRYIVLVEGRFPDALDARGRMEPDPKSGVHKRWMFRSMPVDINSASSGADSGVEAVTDFRRLDYHNGISEVEALLHTGRQHQIRATLCALGFPVVGDKLYGHDAMMFVRFCSDALTDDDWQRLRMKRQALHAGSLEFHHPCGGRALQFHAPVPEDMRKMIGVPS